MWQTSPSDCLRSNKAQPLSQALHIAPGLQGNCGAKETVFPARDTNLQTLKTQSHTQRARLNLKIQINNPILDPRTPFQRPWPRYKHTDPKTTRPRYPFSEADTNCSKHGLAPSPVCTIPICLGKGGQIILDWQEGEPRKFRAWVLMAKQAWVTLDTSSQTQTHLGEKRSMCLDPHPCILTYVHVLTPTCTWLQTQPPGEIQLTWLSQPLLHFVVGHKKQRDYF